LFAFLAKISTQRQKYPRALSLPLIAAFTLRRFAFAPKIMRFRAQFWRAVHGPHGNTE